MPESPGRQTNADLRTDSGDDPQGGKRKHPEHKSDLEEQVTTLLTEISDLLHIKHDKAQKGGIYALLQRAEQLEEENRQLTRRAWMLQRLVDAHNRASSMQADAHVPAKNNPAVRASENTSGLSGAPPSAGPAVSNPGNSLSRWPLYQADASQNDWHHQLDLHMVCPAGLRSAVEALDRAEAGDRRAEALLEVHRVIKYQRQRLSEYSEHARAQLGGSLLLLMQRNAQQPYADVVQAHCTMLDAASLSPHQKVTLAKQTAVHVTELSNIAEEQQLAVDALQQVLVTQSGSVHNSAWKMVKTACIVSKQQKLTQRELDTQLNLWMSFFCSEVLTLEQSARLQTASLAVMPDAAMLGWMLQGCLPPGAPRPLPSQALPSSSLFTADLSSALRTPGTQPVLLPRHSKAGLGRGCASHTCSSVEQEDSGAHASSGTLLRNCPLGLPQMQSAPPFVRPHSARWNKALVHAHTPPSGQCEQPHTSPPAPSLMPMRATMAPRAQPSPAFWPSAMPASALDAHAPADAAMAIIPDLLDVPPNFPDPSGLEQGGPCCMPSASEDCTMADTAPGFFRFLSAAFPEDGSDMLNDEVLDLSQLPTTLTP